MGLSPRWQQAKAASLALPSENSGVAGLARATTCGYRDSCHGPVRGGRLPTRSSLVVRYERSPSLTDSTYRRRIRSHPRALPDRGLPGLPEFFVAPPRARLTTAVHVLSPYRGATFSPLPVRLLPYRRNVIVTDVRLRLPEFAANGRRPTRMPPRAHRHRVNIPHQSCEIVPRH